MGARAREDNDKGFGETVSNRRKPYGGQPILQGVALGSKRDLEQLQYWTHRNAVEFEAKYLQNRV